LHPYASTAGALDLGFYSGKTNQIFNEIETGSRKIGTFDLLFLLGADSKKDYLKDDFSLSGGEKPFVVYQGHHGDVGAKQADLILPSTSYVEKKVTYVNTEGLVQKTDTIGNMQVDSSSGNESHDD
jgi:NADH-quinone oxidoreductase subunit G